MIKLYNSKLLCRMSYKGSYVLVSSYVNVRVIEICMTYVNINLYVKEETKLSKDKTSYDK